MRGNWKIWLMGPWSFHASLRLSSVEKQQKRREGCNWFQRYQQKYPKAIQQNQLLNYCHIKPSSKYFATIDLCSGYHQIPVWEDSSRLLVIMTPSGRFRMRVLPQEISSSDIFNLLTNCDSETLKNMDDMLEVKEKVENFLRSARKKNLEWKPSGFRI